MLQESIKLKNKNCKFGLSITLTDQIINNQELILSWLKEINVKNISYNSLHFTWKYDKWRDYYERATEFICKSNDILNECIESSIQSKINVIVNKNFKYFGCLAAGVNQVVDKPNADICIYHGEFKNDDSTIDNIYNFDFNNIMNYEKLHYYREFNPLNETECLKCDALFSCGGGCFLQSKKLFGIASKNDKAMCIYNKKVNK